MQSHGLPRIHTEPTTFGSMEEKIYRVALSGEGEESFFELRSTSHWCELCLLFVYRVLSIQAIQIKQGSTYKRHYHNFTKRSAAGCRMCLSMAELCGPNQDAPSICQYRTSRGILKVESQKDEIIFEELNDDVDEQELEIVSATEGTESRWHKKKARQWLSNCQQDHPRCNEIPLSSVRPSRLLEVSISEGLPFLRLRHTRDIAEMPLKYCTLSHCWVSNFPSFSLPKPLVSGMTPSIYQKRKY